VSLETGYQLQHVDRPPPFHNQTDHLFQTFLQIRF
jgi:hypothetical protein